MCTKLHEYSTCPKIRLCGLRVTQQVIPKPSAWKFNNLPISSLAVQTLRSVVLAHT